MATKKLDEDQLLKLREIEQQIAQESKHLVKSIAAWRYWILWLSSYNEGVLPGSGDADFHLTQQQSAEFAFSFDPMINPDVLVILAQDKLYECLKFIGLKCIIIEEDGIVLVIKDLDINGFYIAGMSVKIKSSLALRAKMIQARKYCSEFQIGKIASKFNPQVNKVIWNVTDIYDVNFPVSSNLLAAKNM